MKTARCFLYIISLFIITFALSSCRDIWGVLDNPADPDGTAYQGFETVSDVGEVRPTSSDYGESPFLPTLTATKVIGADVYVFQIAATSDFTAPLFESGELASNILVPTEWTVFSPSTTYHWRVKAKRAGVWGLWSTFCTFSIAPLDAIAPFPTDGGTTPDTTPLLDWNDVAGASSYEIQIAATADGVAGSTAILTTGSEYQVSTALDNGDVRYWRVRAKNADNVWSAWSGTWSFIKDYIIGDAGPAGGTVFYDKGAVSDGWRYLEAAPSDQSTDVQWGGYGTSVGGTATGIGTGKANTDAIVSVLGSGTYAARICYDLVLGGFNDWFLPSMDELNLMYGQKGVIGGFASDNYWSSWEYDSYDACYQYFGYGWQNFSGKGAGLRVRAVRAF